MVVFQIMCETYVLRDSSLPLRSGIRHAEPAWNGRGTAPTSQGFPLVFALVGIDLGIIEVARDVPGMHHMFSRILVRKRVSF